MCRICRHLGFQPSVDPPLPGLTDEQLEALDEAFEQREAAEDRAREEVNEREWAELNAQGKSHPKAGGKRPRRRGTIPKVVVEPAPSHDGAPTFAAWAVRRELLTADPTTEDRYGGSPSARAQRFRPELGLRIYDTTADAGAERAAMLARRISELTRGQRGVEDELPYSEDRIEVVAFALPASTKPKERAVACIAHNEAERAVRLVLPDAAAAASWYIVEDVNYNADYTKTIWVINELKESWEEGLGKAKDDWDTRSYRQWFPDRYPAAKSNERGAHGHLPQVYYDESDSSLSDSEDEQWERRGNPRRDFHVRKFPLEEFGSALGGFRYSTVWGFYGQHQHLLVDGVLEMELSMARAFAAADAGKRISLRGDEDEVFMTACVARKVFPARLAYETASGVYLDN